ncbi:MAG: DegT/DnrJ/EryC1/StrS family aminotransferase [Nanoarchaeota archaeon]|nr:DegT/DnrJ/EryC1/StrS family aminotransferase [Nanoarchaeota archaeon]MCG2718521.1 DegT/DnrJ/EryC1/StrS family aminotransferase [Nanoarchaeota archaeon]
MIKHILAGLKSVYENYDNPLFRFAQRVYVSKRRDMINFRQYDSYHNHVSEDMTRELNLILNFRNDFEFWFYTRDFENEFAKRCKVSFALGTHSGTSALQLSLASLGIGPGDEVITVPNSYIATALAISNVGAKPVFVDVDEKNFNMDPCLIEDAITDDTKAIMPVHLYGQMADMYPIIEISKKHGLFVVEDACQSFGASYHGKPPCTLGDVGCFSFFTGKNLGGLGNGGMVLLNNSKIAEKLKKLRDPESNCVDLNLSRRTPCYLDAVQIAFLKAKLPYVNRWANMRRKIVDSYSKGLKDLNNVILPLKEENCKHSYYSYVIRCERRNELKDFLFKKGIEVQVEYGLPIHLTKTYNHLGYKEGDFPITERLSKEILSLPLSAFLKEGDISRIVSAIREFYSKK